jgi:hypothetical protein
MKNAPSPYLVLQARAEARAMLYEASEYDSIEQAIAPLLKAAQAQGLIEAVGAETIEAIIRKPFEKG